MICYELKNNLEFVSWFHRKYKRVREEWGNVLIRIPFWAHMMLLMCLMSIVVSIRPFQKLCLPALLSWSWESCFADLSHSCAQHCSAVKNECQQLFSSFFFFQLHAPLSIRWQSQMWHTQVRYGRQQTLHISFPITWFLLLSLVPPWSVWQHHDDDCELSQVFFLFLYCCFTLPSSWTRDIVCFAPRQKYTQFNFSILFFLGATTSPQSFTQSQSLFTKSQTRWTWDTLLVWHFRKEQERVVEWEKEEKYTQKIVPSFPILFSLFFFFSAFHLQLMLLCLLFVVCWQHQHSEAFSHPPRGSEKGILCWCSSRLCYGWMKKIKIALG